jgi:cell division protein FtsB
MGKNDESSFKTVLEETETTKNSFNLQQSFDYQEDGFFVKVKKSIGKIVITVLVVVCLIGIIYLLIEGIDIKALKAQISGFESRIEDMKKENDSLKAELTNIKNEMEKLKTVKKPVQAQTPKQNKSVKPRGR